MTLSLMVSRCGAGPITVVASAQAVDLGVKVAGGYLYLVAVNTDTEASACEFDVSLWQRRLPKTARVEVLFSPTNFSSLVPHPRPASANTTTTISLGGGGTKRNGPGAGTYPFTFRAPDGFAPLGVAVYRIRLSIFESYDAT